jgi:hypothetical protein
VSVKDRWVDAPRASIECTNRMLVYGPNEPSSLLSTGAWLNPIVSLNVRGEKLGGDPQISQSVCWGCNRESLFLRSSVIGPNLSVTHKRLLYMDHVRYIWPRDICRPSIKSGWRVGRIFPCRAYIESNHRDSDMSTACLW